MANGPTEREIGFAEGVIDQRLAQYDRHFDAINGSVAETARQLAELVRAVDALGAAQREATTLAEAVAAALEKKEEAGDKTALKWRGVVAWGAGLFVAAFAVAGGVKAWFGG